MLRREAERRVIEAAKDLCDVPTVALRDALDALAALDGEDGA